MQVACPFICAYTCSVLPLCIYHRKGGINMVRASVFASFPILRLIIQIPEAYLKISARTSLTALQIWWLGTPDLKDAIEQHHDLDPGIASLVLACQRLRKNGYRKGRIPLTQNSILNRHVQAMVDDLTEDTLKIFGLLTCHFNEDFGVPLPRQLLRFFDTPWKLLGYVCIGSTPDTRQWSNRSQSKALRESLSTY